MADPIRSDPIVDIGIAGPVYFDLVFGGLSGMPRAGTEVRSAALASAPGGVANVAVALRRLEMSVALAAPFADDAFGNYLWGALRSEGVDLSASRRFPGWSTPVTVSLAYDCDRSLVTHETAALSHDGELLAALPPSRAVVVSLASMSADVLAALGRRGALVVADVCWDDSGQWTADLLDRLATVDLFMPNAVEAMAYTGEASASEALQALGRRTTGTVVVKAGAAGALAYEDGEVVAVPAPSVRAVDPTGAGDVFDAAFLYGTLASWSLSDRLRFANLCAGLSVQRYGGSLSAPCWLEVEAFCSALPDAERDALWNFVQPALRARRRNQPCTRACLTIPCTSLAAELAGGVAEGADR